MEYAIVIVGAVLVAGVSVLTRWWLWTIESKRKARKHRAQSRGRS